MTGLVEPVSMAPMAQYGAVGVAAAAFLVTFLWAFRYLFVHVLRDHRRFMDAQTQAMQAQTKALEQIVDTQAEHHESIRAHFAEQRQGLVELHRAIGSEETTPQPVPPSGRPLGLPRRR